MTKIHPKINPLASVDSAANIAENVEIGAFCVVGANVTLGYGVRLHSHVVIDGNTKIGNDTIIYPFTSIGTPPQDLKYGGEESFVEIGNNTVIREHVTINSGTVGGGLYTKVGNNCLLMVGVHIAHDCIVHDNVIMANNATLAGHVIVENNAILGGLSAVHQFVRIGQGAMIGGLTGVEQDVLPYSLVMGERGVLRGLNLVGLKRGNYDKADIAGLQSLYGHLFNNDSTPFAQRKQNATYNGSLAEQWKTFIDTPTKRGICLP